MSKSRRTIDEQEFAEALRRVKQFLMKESSINNRKLRDLTGVNSDQAIAFFNMAIERGVLQRRGRAAGTHYTLLK